MPRHARNWAALTACLAASLTLCSAQAQQGSGSGGSGASGARSSGPSRSGPAAPAPRITAPTAPSTLPGDTTTPGATATQPVTPSPAPGTATNPASPGRAQSEPSQTTPGTTPPAGTAQPAPQQQPVAPLSPRTQSPVASGGGSARQDSGVGSRGLSPSAPGGGGKSLADCMKFWEPATHMTKQQWRAACQRTLQRVGS